MKIVKPDTMAFVHRALRWQGQDRLCVGLVALFPLASPGLDALRPETELWQQLPQLPGAPAVLDEGLPKPRAEFLLYGEACAPKDTPVAQLAVRVRVGACDKPLLVHGDRHWTALGTVSAPSPFTRMAIVPANAFGGPGDPVNPLGKGAQPDASGVRPLPNVEDPRHPIAFAGDHPAPAGYWGVESSAPARQRLLGAVDARWLQKTWPHLPEDTQPDYFQSAPEDQRLPGLFSGDEAIALSNLAPGVPEIASTLPGLRGRCFVQRGKGGDARFEEIETRPETLWLMPSLGLAALLYRGTLAVGDEDARDVACLVAGWEPMREPRRAESHYREQLPPALAAQDAAAGIAGDALTGAVVSAATSAALASAGGGAAALAAGAASAVGTGAAMAVGGGSAGQVAGAAASAAAAAKDPAVALATTSDPKLAEIERLTAEMNAKTDRLLAEHGIPRSRIDAMMNPPPPRETTLQEIEQMSLRLDAQRQQLLTTHGLTQADVDTFVASRQGPMPTAMSLEELQAMTQKLMNQKDALLSEHGLTNTDVAAFLQGRGASDEAVALMKQSRPDLEALYAALPPVSPAAASLAAPAAAAALPPVAAAGIAMAARPPVQAEKPPTTREEVIAWHQRQKSFAGLDLSRLDLSELDLSGADFSRALLEKTRFDGSRLVGTRFDHALLPGASFNAIDGARSQFTQARGAGSVFAQAALAGATLDAADFSGCNFEGASLEGASCARTDFSGSRMASLKAAQGKAAQADFSSCSLESADFKGATLTAARLNGARLDAASFSGASAVRSEWYQARAPRADFAAADLSAARAGAGSSFEGANLRGARLVNAAWDGGVDLRGASMQTASLDGADLSEAEASGVNLAGASAQRANLSHAVLDGADASGANLMGASLRHTRLAAARLTDANLHASDCYGSAIVQANTRGALTTGTLMQVPGRPEAVRA